jgi:hypothetical protein
MVDRGWVKGEWRVLGVANGITRQARYHQRSIAKSLSLNLYRQLTGHGRAMVALLGWKE